MSHTVPSCFTIFSNTKFDDLVKVVTARSFHFIYLFFYPYPRTFFLIAFGEGVGDRKNTDVREKY